MGGIEVVGVAEGLRGIPQGEAHDRRCISREMERHISVVVLSHTVYYLLTGAV